MGEGDRPEGIAVRWAVGLCALVVFGAIRGMWNDRPEAPWLGRERVGYGGDADYDWCWGCGERSQAYLRTFLLVWPRAECVC